MKFLSNALTRILVITFLFICGLSIKSKAQMAYPLSDYLEYDNTKISSLTHFYEWLNEVSSSIYVKNMQNSLSARGDSKYISLNMSASKSMEQVEFLKNSGININFKPDGDNTAAWPSISAQTRFPALAYLRNFQMDQVDPIDLKKLFGLGLEMAKIIPSEVAAHMVNTYYQDRMSHEEFKNFGHDDSEKEIRYAIKPFFDKLKAKYGVEIQSYPSRKEFYANYAMEIEKKTKHKFSDVVFELLIQGKTEKETESNFDRFMRIPEFTIEKIKYMIAPNGNIKFSNRAFSLDFDPNIFYTSDLKGEKAKSMDKVSLSPEFLSYRYEFGRKGWQLVLEFSGFDNKNPYYFLITQFATLNFKATGTKYDAVKDKEFFVVNSTKLNKLVILISKDTISGIIEHNSAGFTSYEKFLNRKIQ